MLKLLPILLILPAIATHRLSQQIDWKYIVTYLFAISAATYLLYWHDKRSAQKAHQRTPESTLHLLELLGGWPAAILAQQQFRHKTSKPAYRRMFWAIILLHQYLCIEFSFHWLLLRSLRKLLA